MSAQCEHGFDRAGRCPVGEYACKQATLENAIAYFVHEVDAAYGDAARAMVEKGEAVWIHDPDVDKVYGLVLRGTNDALAVVYGPDENGFVPRPRWDFETSDRLDRLVDGDDTPFGKGGDHCPWCGADWKAEHERDCSRPE